jgi:hypothetical protein
MEAVTRPPAQVGRRQFLQFAGAAPLMVAATACEVHLTDAPAESVSSCVGGDFGDGQWTRVQDAGLVAIHAACLRDGHVLTLSYSNLTNMPDERGSYQVWILLTRTFETGAESSGAGIPSAQHTASSATAGSC